MSEKKLRQVYFPQDMLSLEKVYIKINSFFSFFS